MTQISHSSTNSGNNYYAKSNFEGTEETQKAQKNVSIKKRNTRPLMSPSDWKAFCIKRWN